MKRIAGSIELGFFSFLGAASFVASVAYSIWKHSA